MKATGIIRRFDNLGRIVIPNEIRRSLRLREGDAMELFLDGNTICLKKYEVSNDDLSAECREYLAKMGKYVKAINFINNTTVVVFTNGKTATVSKYADDIFDMNVALCYAFEQVGYTANNPIHQ